jgi:hypothetical protein
MTVPGQGAETPSTREDPCGTDRVKSAEVPTNVKEVVARFARGDFAADDRSVGIGPSRRRQRPSTGNIARMVLDTPIHSDQNMDVVLPSSL